MDTRIQDGINPKTEAPNTKQNEKVRSSRFVEDLIFRFLDFGFQKGQARGCDGQPQGVALTVNE